VDPPAAIEAGLDVVKALGRGNARLLLEVLELPDDERLAFISSMYQREDGEALAEVLADVEQDLTGRTRERLMVGLQAALG